MSNNYMELFETLVKNIFQSEDEGKIGYQISISTNHINKDYITLQPISIPSGIKHERIYQGDDQPFEDLERVKIDNKLLGSVEYKLIVELVTTPYTLMLLTGGIGSGKTALCRYVMNYLNAHFLHGSCPDRDNCSFQRNVIIYHNFTRGVYSDNLPDFEQEITSEISVLLTSELQEIINSAQIQAQLIQGIFSSERRSNIWSYFPGFRREWDGDKKLRLMGMPSREFAITLFNWIEAYYSQPNLKLPVLNAILSFVNRMFASKKRGCFIFVFDNIDLLSDSQQFCALDKIMHLVEKTGAKTVIPIRVVNLSKIYGNGSFSFVLNDNSTILENAGARPVRIVTRRIQYYLDNQDEFIDEVRNIPLQIREVFNNRVRLVLKLLQEKPESRLNLALAALAANSIRRGLYLSERLFINSVIQLDSSQPTQDAFIEAMLVGVSPSKKMQIADGYITNIFIDSMGGNSLVKLRVLHLLNNCFESDALVRLGDIITNIMRYTKHSKDSYEQLRYAVNDLIKVRNRLAVIDGVNHYDSVSSLLTSHDDYIQITPTGRKYLDTLCESLSYVQCCFSAMRWTHNYLVKYSSGVKYLLDDINEEMKSSNPQNVQNIHLVQAYISSIVNDNNHEISIPITTIMCERLEYIRQALQHLLYQDVFEMRNYYDGICPCPILNKFDPSILIIAEIIRKLSYAIPIITQNINAYDRNMVLSNWLSLINIAAYWEFKFFRGNQNKFTFITSKFENALASK